MEEIWHPLDLAGYVWYIEKKSKNFSILNRGKKNSTLVCEV